jgi:serine/threonine protein kinase
MPAPRLKDRYQIEAQLGQSELATTYLARDLTRHRPVVVKELALGRVEAEKTVELFEREAKVLARLKHPRIPRFIEFFSLDSTDDVRLYLVQEQVAGKNLAQLVKEGKHFSPREVIQLGIQLAGILEHLHALSPPVIHRDIKPSNVLLDSAGKAYLIDFGAVREILSPRDGGRTVAGTYGYMPFEQFEGRAAPASDLYSLGATLLFLLSHKAPHQMEAEPGVLDFRPHLNVSEAFAEVLEKTVRPAWEDRYQSASELRAALEALLAGKRPARKRRAILLAAAFLLLLAGGGLAWLAYRVYYGRTLGGHRDSVGSLAFSRDGKYLASASNSETFIWDARSGWRIRELSERPDPNAYTHLNAASPIAFSPDGRHLASGKVIWGALPEKDFDRVLIWDVTRGTIVRRLSGPAARLDSLAYNPEGRVLAVASNVWNDSERHLQDGEIRLWDVEAGRLLYTIRRGGSPLHSVSFSPDGRHLAFASRVWNPKSRWFDRGEIVLADSLDGRQVGSIPGGTYPPQYLAFSPDGTRMAISYASCQEVTVWGLDGRAIARLNLEPDLLGYRAFAPGSFSPDGSYFAAPARAKTPSSDRARDQIRIWDTATWRLVGSLTIRSPIKNYLLDSLVFSAEAGRLAVGLGNDLAGEVKLLQFSSER